VTNYHKSTVFSEIFSVKKVHSKQASQGS